MKEAVKKSAGSSGIMTINKNIAKDVDKLLQKYINDALAQGVDLDTLSPEQLKMIVAINSKPKVIPGTSAEGKAITEKLFGKRGEVIEGNFGKPFAQEVDDITDKKIIEQMYRTAGPRNLDEDAGYLAEFIAEDAGKVLDDLPITEQNKFIERAKNALKKNVKKYQEKSVKELIESGQVKKGTDNIIISEKITDREMFKNSNLNKEPVSEKFIDYTIQDINKKEPIEGMKIANKIIKREGEFKDLTEAQSQRILKETDDHLTGKDIDYDPEDFYATGGRAGFYTGGITDVEPRLDDIGHGADSLMSRTRLMSPGAQATTSTGLNYLLAEDNDNLRVPFNAGGDPKRRLFLKLLAALTGGIAGVKSGFIGLGGKEAGKKAVTESVKQSVGSGNPPPYFFKLVEKIKTMGDETLASQDKAIAKKYKDYVMEEDFAGNISIIKKNMDDPYPEEVIMTLKVDEVPVKGKRGSVKVDDYEEFTLRPDGDGKMKDIEPGVPDDVVNEGSVFEDNMTEFGMTKKADGGRIGFRVGGSGKKFIEKIFGKGSLDVMKARDPELHKGMLEVVEMFRKRDKEGLKMYLQKFLPHMDDETIEAFIIGDAADAAGQAKYGLDNIQGQLIRLGSGRDYAGKIKMVKDAENMRALDKLDVTDRKPNASGGLQTMLGE